MVLSEIFPNTIIFVIDVPYNMDLDLQFKSENTLLAVNLVVFLIKQINELTDFECVENCIV